MITSPDFPRLTAANHRITSPSTPDYNCIAWSVDDAEHWWQPGVFWPIASPKDGFGIETLADAMKSQGFAVCEMGVPEEGFKKLLCMQHQPFTLMPPGNCPVENGPASSAGWRTSSTTLPTTLLVESTARWYFS